MTWQLRFSRQADKDSRNLRAVGLKSKAEAIFEVLQADPFKNPPPYEKLGGDMKGFYSRRLNIQHRVVYQVFKTEKIVLVLSVWSHYE